MWVPKELDTNFILKKKMLNNVLRFVFSSLYK